MSGYVLFTYEYNRYRRIVDERMRGPIFADTAKIYARPRLIRPGDAVEPTEIANLLRHAGYVEAGRNVSSSLGSYRLGENSIEIMPGPKSSFSPEGARILFTGGRVERITHVADSSDDALAGYALEPQLITGLCEPTHRSKRRLLSYDGIPKILRDAILSIEDRRFFEHKGVNYWRLAQAVYNDIRTGQNTRGGGGSTLTMQFAKGYFLSGEKTVTRKMAQIMIALQLEQRFSKQEIFATYVNWVPMGQRGPFSIAGMGEAAEAYFRKDVKDLKLEECALLAALIQQPSRLNPYRHPEGAQKRRNLVLDTMVATGALTPAEAERAKKAPLGLAPPNVDSNDAPYFVDLVRESLLEEFNGEQLDADRMRVYTSLDSDLEKAAVEAVTSGAYQIDELIHKQRTTRTTIGEGKDARTETRELSGPLAQVALIALDPHTAEILALVGGRDYAVSQLNHALVKRPTGSSFKPFVYAAALNSAVEGTQPIFTETTLLDDSPSTYEFGNQVYTPRNFHDEYRGQVTTRYALAHSLNNATLKLAEAVGYDRVAKLALNAGITSVKPTPAIALGAYDATPLEIAGAYTTFANDGTRLTPVLVNSVRDANGVVLASYASRKQHILDPRVAYLTTHMMEEVLNTGTAARVRSLGFTAPAAGKTGTSRDGWFVGYTSQLLCVVWVGFDDYRDLNLEGANSAAPIWAMFMKKAMAVAGYKEVKPFTPPPGVVVLNLDKVTNLIATPACADSYDAAFLEGTEPKETCDSAPGNQEKFFKNLLSVASGD